MDTDYLIDRMTRKIARSEDKIKKVTELFGNLSPARHYEFLTKTNEPLQECYEFWDGMSKIAEIGLSECEKSHLSRYPAAIFRVMEKMKSPYASGALALYDFYD